MKKTCRILLVDDERGIAEGLSILLMQTGQPWEIVGIAEDGEQGIRMVHQLDPDIVITDVRMPVMDGLEMIRHLTEEGTRCRFIILSGYADFTYAQQAMRLGVRSYVTKPVDEDELADAILSLQLEAEKNAEPEADSAEAAPTRQDTFDRMLEYIREHFNQDITQQELSEQFYLNPVYISQLFRKRLGMTYQTYLTRLRIDRARQYLEQTDLMVYEISELVGYSDTAYFSRVFEKTVGIRPTDYRKKLSHQQKSRDAT